MCHRLENDGYTLDFGLDGRYFWSSLVNFVGKIDSQIALGDDMGMV